MTEILFTKGGVEDGFGSQWGLIEKDTPQQQPSAVECLQQPSLAMQELREAFVTARGWPCAPNDKDAYDESATNTQHFGFVNPEGKLVAGMRLTPVSPLSGCLSIAMLSNNEGMAGYVTAWANEAATGRERNFYDLTRLVAVKPSSIDELHLIRAGMAQMFGAGLDKTYSSEESRKPLWVFASTSDMIGVLESMGIAPKEVGRGCVSEEDRRNGVETLFCVIDPHEAYCKLLQDEKHRDTLEGVLAGIRGSGNLSNILNDSPSELN